MTTRSLHVRYGNTWPSNVVIFRIPVRGRSVQEMDLGWAALGAAGFGLPGPFLLRPAGQCLSIALAGRIFWGVRKMPLWCFIDMAFFCYQYIKCVHGTNVFFFAWWISQTRPPLCLGGGLGRRGALGSRCVWIWVDMGSASPGPRPAKYTRLKPAAYRAPSDLISFYKLKAKVQCASVRLAGSISLLYCLIV